MAQQPIVIKYDYSDVPTIAKFAASNAFIRGLMGPFGCTPGDTEFLTPNGWKRIDQFCAGDLVLQWSPSGQTEFVIPDAYINGPAETFIRFESGALCMELSPDHRVPHFGHDGAFQVLSAAEIAEHVSRRSIPAMFSPPVRLGLDMSDDLIRFAIMMHADGTYPKEGRQQICVRKERKKIRIRSILRALGVEWSEYTYPQRPTETMFRFVAPYTGKRFEGVWWEASPAQLSLILDEVILWDGHCKGQDHRYYSSHKCDVDFIQYAAHVSGRIAHIGTTEFENPNHNTAYLVQLQLASNSVDPKLRQEVKISTINAFGQMQYCFTVKSGFWVARLRDYIFVTGNSGKSSGCVAEIIRRSMAQKKSSDGMSHTRWVVVRNTSGQLSDTTIKTFHQWLPPQHFGRHYEQDSTYFIKGIQGCNIEVMFRALDRPDHIRNVLSLEVTGAWINEAREIPWGIIDAIQARVGRYPSAAMGGLTWSGIFMDTNPPDVDSKWYKFFEETQHPPNFAAIFKQPSGLSANAENLINLPSKEYYTRLSVGKSPEWVKVYIDGQYGFTVDGKPVFGEYNDKAHCKEVNPIPGVPVYRGWDWGLTCACSFSQILPDGRWLVFDELTSDNMGADRFSDEVIAHSTQCFPRGAEFKDIGDPAGEARAQTDEKTCFQILQAKGIDIEGGDQSVAIRLESIRKPLRSMVGGEPMFIIHPRCKILRKGFMGDYHYRRMQISQERYTAKPDKNFASHIMDSLGYVGTRLFGGGLTTMQSHQEDYGSMAYRSSEGERNPWTGY